jgi:hypothetical protein
MGDWQQRVVNEKKALDRKIIKLMRYNLSPAYTKDNNEKEQARLSDQLIVMQQYSQILRERIDCFAN